MVFEILANLSFGADIIISSDVSRDKIGFGVVPPRPQVTCKHG